MLSVNPKSWWSSIGYKSFNIFNLTRSTRLSPWVLFINFSILVIYLSMKSSVFFCFFFFPELIRCLLINVLWHGVRFVIHDDEFFSILWNLDSGFKLHVIHYLWLQSVVILNTFNWFFLQFLLKIIMWPSFIQLVLLLSLKIILVSFSVFLEEVYLLTKSYHFWRCIFFIFHCNLLDLKSFSTHVIIYQLSNCFIHDAICFI